MPGDSALDAKLNLYGELLNKPHDQLTKLEIDMMFSLSMDPGVRSHIEKALKPVKGESNEGR